jgi:hypothetical protein
MTSDCNSEDNIVQQNRLAFVTSRAETIDEVAARSVFRGSLKDCVDPTSQIQSENRRFSQSTRAIEVDGIYTAGAVQALSDEFEENISVTRRFGTPIDQAVSDFGDSFYNSLNDLNRFLNGRDIGEFPTLNDRISQFPEVTPIEYAEFIREFLYTPTVTTVNITFNPTLLLTQLDQFYVKNFTQSAIGGFCALMPQVFGAINQFFTAIGQLSRGINGIIAALRERAIQELMRRIAQEVSRIIDRTVEKVLGIITNFSIESVFDDVNTFVNEHIVGRLVELKERILTFFTRENLQNVRRRVEDLITYAVGVFQNPTLEEIQFLVYRFCSFAAQVEALINGLKDPLTFFAGNYRETIRNLRIGSSANTIRAIQGGAIRFSDTNRAFQINTAEEMLVDRAGGPLQPAIDDFAGIPTWEEVRSGRSSSFGITVGNQSFAENPVGQRQHEGWTELDHARFLPRLVLLQREFGQKMIITSGYRSPELNRSVGGARRSLHMSGSAVDISAGAAARNRIESIARRIGFDEIIQYPSQNFIHVGLRIGGPGVRENRRSYEIRVDDARRRGVLRTPF